MKRRYAFILILTLVAGLAACGKEEKSENISGTNKTEVVAQTDKPSETDKPQAEDNKENDLPIVEFEEPTNKSDADVTAPVLSQETVTKQTEAPAAVPSESPTEAPVAEPMESPTEKPTTSPKEQPTEAPTEAPTEEPAEPTEKPIELPFAPIN